IRDFHVTGVQTCALPICREPADPGAGGGDLHSPLSSAGRGCIVPRKSKSLTLTTPDRMMPDSTAQTTTATTVVISALRRTTKPEIGRASCRARVEASVGA